MSLQKFRTANDAQDLTGKVGLIVGGTQGIGKSIAVRLAQLGASVAISGRNETAGANVVAELEANSPASAKGKAHFRFYKADISLISEVKRLVNEVKQQCEDTGLNYLFFTAGRVPTSARIETAEGIEYQFAVHDLSRFAITELLVPVLKKAKGGARVISILRPGFTTSIDLDDLELKNGSYSFWSSIKRDSGYNDVATKAFTARYSADGVSFHHLHPGTVATDLINSNPAVPWYIRIPVGYLINFFGVDSLVYADVPVYAATSDEFAVSGRLVNNRLEDWSVAEFTTNPAIGDRLYKYSVERAGLV